MVRVRTIVLHSKRTVKPKRKIQQNKRGERNATRFVRKYFTFSGFPLHLGNLEKMTVTFVVMKKIIEL